MWKGTSKAAGLQKTWPRSLWFFSRWPVTSPRDSCTCINTTSHTGSRIFLLPEATEKLALLYQYNPPSSFIGHFLEQYPGAARVFPTDSSISDFVAGADPPSAEFHSLPAACSSFHLFIINNGEHRKINLSLPSFLHSDLALRNCLLSATVSVKIGDYGLSHLKYKVCCTKHARGQTCLMVVADWVILQNPFHV